MTCGVKLGSLEAKIDALEKDILQLKRDLRQLHVVLNSVSRMQLHLKDLQATLEKLRSI